MTTSSSSPSLLNDGAKNYSHSTHGKILQGNTFQHFRLWCCLIIGFCLIDPVNSPTSSLFSDFGALSLSQRRKVSLYFHTRRSNTNKQKKLRVEAMLACHSARYLIVPQGSKPGSKWIHPKGSSTDGHDGSVCCSGLSLSALPTSRPEQLKCCCTGTRWVLPQLDK